MNNSDKVFFLIAVSAVFMLSASALADVITTPVRFVLPSSLAFSVAIPATNGTFQTGTTTTIIFNATTTTASKINATNCVGCAQVQDSGTAIFRFRNDGNVPLNVTANFTSALPSGVLVKAAWNDAGYQASCGAVNLSATGSCVNVTFGAHVRLANLSTNGVVRDVWLWADYSSATVGMDSTINLQHVSLQT